MDDNEAIISSSKMSSRGSIDDEIVVKSLNKNRPKTFSDSMIGLHESANDLTVAAAAAADNNTMHSSQLSSINLKKNDNITVNGDHNNDQNSNDEWLNDFGWSSDGGGGGGGGAGEGGGGHPSSWANTSILSLPSKSENSSFNKLPGANNVVKQLPHWYVRDEAEIGSEFDVKSIVVKKKETAKKVLGSSEDLLESYLNEIAPKIKPIEAFEMTSTAVTNASLNKKNPEEIGKAWDCDEIDLDNM
jgi:hypothetical protein